MHKSIFIFTVIFIYGSLLAVDAREFQTCDQERVINLYGELSYRRPRGSRSKNENCDWTFSYLGDELDYVVVLDFSFVYRGSHVNNSVTLPSDEVLSESVQFPPCQAYYNASSPLSDCLINLTRLYCSEEPIPVTSWPPKMVTKNHRSTSLHFEMSYVYVTCPIVIQQPIYQVIESASTKPAAVDNINVEKEVLLIGIIALGALFLISLIAFFILLCKFRQRKNDDKESKMDSNNTSRSLDMMGASVENQAYEEIIPHHVTVIGESIYDTAADQYGMDMSENSIYQHLS